MTIELARELAAQCWCQETTKNKVMAIELAEEIAKAIWKAYRNGRKNGIEYATTLALDGSLI